MAASMMRSLQLQRGASTIQRQQQQQQHSCTRPCAAARVQQRRSIQAFAAVEADEIIDLDTAKLQGAMPGSGSDDADVQEFSVEELIAAAESTHYANLAVADVEVAFLEGSSTDAEVASYLSGLQSEAEGLLLEQKGPGVREAALAAAAAAAEFAQAGDVPDAAVVAELGRRPVGSGPRDVLERLSNDEALAARRVVSAVKLSRQELEDELLPEDWDATTVDWFSNKDESEVPLPEYRLMFLWLDKTLACAIDQVYARGNTAPLTEFFMWPREDAWEELKVALEAKPWIGDAETVQLLNRLTMVINFWTGEQQFDEEGNPVGEPVQPSIDAARAAFPDCAFVGGAAN